jgi:hypothetical protein
MATKQRDPRAKQSFGGGNRQKWAFLLILCAAGILVANMKVPSIDPEPYLTFLTMVGCVFLAGLSVDSYAKIRAEEHSNPEPYHDQEPDHPHPEENRHQA